MFGGSGGAGADSNGSDAHGAGVRLRVASCPNQDLARTNHVFVSQSDFAYLAQQQLQQQPAPQQQKRQQRGNTGALLAHVGASYVYALAAEAAVEDGTLALNSVQRRDLQLALADPVDVRPYAPPSAAKQVDAVSLSFEVDTVVKRRSAAQVDVNADELEGLVHSKLSGTVATVGQAFVIDYYGTSLLLRTGKVELVSVTEQGPVASFAATGQLTADTALYFSKAHESPMRIRGGDRRPKEIFRPDFNFERMGIGGLDKEFSDIFRRSFASRVFPPSVIHKLGVTHVKGMLLYGPPGTGKTLIARQIGKMLNGKEPKVINGPEILNKYVGQSEENVRNLFKDAEADQEANGDQSELHIIIFDEIDAVCKQRGSQRDGTGVHDTVVNQLLSKIDGVNALNNILVIGMTNRKDMIDEALLRPGRLEVHVEIGLPDERGRLQILRIHTSKMRENHMLTDDVDLDTLASGTKNYSGAEIEGLCKSAAAFALNRQVDVDNLTKPVDPDAVRVGMQDFSSALEEVQPAFGVNNEDLERCLLGGFIEYGERLSHLLRSGRLFREQVANSERSPLLSVLVEGASGTGKTALAAKLALESNFPFVRMVSPENYVGYSEAAKVAAIAKVFDDAYRSPLSVVVLDNIERLLEYASIGPRFSNVMLQTLMVLVKQTPPQDRRLLIVATTSSADVMDVLELRGAFQASLRTECLEPDEIAAVVRDSRLRFRSAGEQRDAVDALSTKRLGVKKVLMLLEMASVRDGDGDGESGGTVSVERLTEVLADVQ